MPGDPAGIEAALDDGSALEVMRMDDLREDYEIFLIECPHRRFLTFDSAEWCPECNDWIEGRPVGTVTIWVAQDGAIEAIGSGYIGIEEEARVALRRRRAAHIDAVEAAVREI